MENKVVVSEVTEDQAVVVLRGLVRNFSGFTFSTFATNSTGNGDRISVLVSGIGKYNSSALVRMKNFSTGVLFALDDLAETERMCEHGSCSFCPEG